MRRVVLTGAGVVSALGCSMSSLAAALKRGQSGIRPISPERLSDGVERVAACVNDDADGCFTSQELALFDPVTQHAVRAARQALAQSRLLEDRGLTRTAGIFFGTGMGGIQSIESACRDTYARQAAPKPLAILRAMANAPAAHLSIEFGISGPTMTYSVACASSALAIGEAYQAIRSGRLECALAGGAEACISTGVLRSWESMRVLARPDRENASASCRPFSKDRSGIVLGEGAAMFVLETPKSAARRNAPIIAELLGYGVTSDAVHICNPSADGQAAAMRAALAAAGLEPTAIDYVNTHGTATGAGDSTETTAIRNVFGKHAARLPVSSTKSVHGHLLGAAGALELAVCVTALREHFLPATMHLRAPDPACDLDYVANEPRLNRPIDTFMSNSFAFGGTNAVLIGGRATARSAAGAASIWPPALTSAAMA